MKAMPARSMAIALCLWMAGCEDSADSSDESFTGVPLTNSVTTEDVRDVQFVYPDHFLLVGTTYDNGVTSGWVRKVSTAGAVEWNTVLLTNRSPYLVKVTHKNTYIVLAWRYDAGSQTFFSQLQEMSDAGAILWSREYASEFAMGIEILESGEILLIERGSSVLLRVFSETGQEISQREVSVPDAYNTHYVLMDERLYFYGYRAFFSTNLNGDSLAWGDVELPSKAMVRRGSNYIVISQGRRSNPYSWDFTPKLLSWTLYDSNCVALKQQDTQAEGYLDMVRATTLSDGSVLVTGKWMYADAKALIMKFSEDGVWQWSKLYGSEDRWTYGRDPKLHVAADNTFYLTMSLTNQMRQTVVFHLDSDGNLLNAPE